MNIKLSAITLQFSPQKEIRDLMSYMWMTFGGERRREGVRERWRLRGNQEER